MKRFCITYYDSVLRVTVLYYVLRLCITCYGSVLRVTILYYDYFLCITFLYNLLTIYLSVCIKVKLMPIPLASLHSSSTFIYCLYNLNNKI